jgi:hypothetical protein
MKTRHCAWAAMLLALAGPVQAKGFAWCQVNGARYETYLSAIVEVGDGPEAYRALTGAFGKGFQDYVRASLDPKASSVDCNRQDTRFFAEDYIDVLIRANPGYNFVKTGWRGGAGSTAAASAPRRGGAGSRIEAARYGK